MSPLWFSSRGGTCEGGNVIWLDTRGLGAAPDHREMQGNTEKRNETQRNAGKHRETHTHRYKEAAVMDERRVQEEENGIAYSSKLIC